MRTCIACRRIFAKNELIAITRLADEQVAIAKTAFGRSVYLCRSQACLSRLQKRNDNPFSRSLKITIDKERIFQRLNEILTLPKL